MLALHVLASGSKGNAAIVEDTATGASVAIDCGICARDYKARLAEAGVDPGKILALFITHEHTDHTKGLGATLRALKKMGVEFPVYVDPAVRAASSDIRAVQDTFSLVNMRLDQPLALDAFTVLPFTTSHDAASSCGFRVECGADSVGYLTDSGVVTPQAAAGLSRVRLLAFEANHDEKMLREGTYPAPLKARIASDRGHLSNRQSAAELDALCWSGLEQVVAMHISENNNTYDLPVQALREAVGSAPSAPHVQCAYQRHLVSVR